MINKRLHEHIISSAKWLFHDREQKYDVARYACRVPPKVEYSYSGRMKLVAFAKPLVFQE